MTIRDIRELLRDWKALTGLIMLISAVVGSSGYVGCPALSFEDEVVPIVAEKEVETWDTPLATSQRRTSLAPNLTPIVPTTMSATSTDTNKATQTPLTVSSPTVSEVA